MAEQAEILDEAVKLLREGKVQDADDLLSKHRAALKPAEPPPPPPPRKPHEVLTELLQVLHEALGSPERLEPLIREWKKVVSEA